MKKGRGRAHGGKFIDTSKEKKRRTRSMATQESNALQKSLFDAAF